MLDGPVEHLADGRPLDRARSGPGGFAGGGEQADGGHGVAAYRPCRYPPAAMTGLRTTSTRLLVLRHGRTPWNAEGRWQGHADVPLDDHGEQQAAAVADVLGAFDAVWASDLQRAVRTAAIIGELLGVGPVQVDPRLRETDVGPWEGLTHDEVEAGWPGFLAEHRRPEGFEDYGATAQRMAAALRSIAAAHRGGEVLIVSHSGAIRALRRTLVEPDVRLANLAGAWFSVDPDGGLRAGDLVEPLG